MDNKVSLKEKTIAEKKNKGEFFSAIGRRKESTAQIRLYSKNKKENIKIVINDVPFERYFKDPLLRNYIISPLKVVGLDSNFDISVKVKGGGLKGQADAIKLGIARALLKFDSVFKSTLRKEGFLTCDSRVKERKKYGLHKARRAPQFRKR